MRFGKRSGAGSYIPAGDRMQYQAAAKAAVPAVREEAEGEEEEGVPGAERENLHRQISMYLRSIAGRDSDLLVSRWLVSN